MVSRIIRTRIPLSAYIALLLTVVMGTLTGADGVQAVGSATGRAHTSSILPPTRDLVRAVSWSSVPEDLEYITPMIWIRPTGDIAALAEESRRKPPGEAAVFYWHIERDLLDHPLDQIRVLGRAEPMKGVWFDHGIARVRERIERFIRRYHEHGGRVDYLIIDFEEGRGIWHFDSATREENIARILNDPRAASFIEELKALGLEEEQFGEIANHLKHRPRYRLGVDDLKQVDVAPYVIWNAAAGKRVADALHQAAIEPVLELYPHAEASNYIGAGISREHRVPALHGHLHYDLKFPGTNPARPFYGRIGQLATMPTAGGTAYGDSAYAALRLEVNRVRAMHRSNEVRAHAWVAIDTFELSRFTGNEYYAELIYHLALNGVRRLIYWNPTSKYGQEQVDQSARRFNDLLTSINQRLDGAMQSLHTVDPMLWDSTVIVSAMRLDDRLLWRITVPEGTSAVHIPATNETIDLNGRAGFWYESVVEFNGVFEHHR